MNIYVRIEQLVLDGVDVPRHQRPALRAAVEAELTQLMHADGLAPGWSGGGTIPSVRAGSIEVADAGDPVRMGRQIARAVYGGIKR
jgi:hypothetical protein